MMVAVMFVVMVFIIVAIAVVIVFFCGTIADTHHGLVDWTCLSRY